MRGGFLLSLHVWGARESIDHVLEEVQFTNSYLLLDLMHDMY